jgi:hypothetical protein
MAPSHRRALILQGGVIVGGVDLPEKADEFIAQFNGEYAAAGLSLRRPPQLRQALEETDDAGGNVRG